MLLKKTNQVRCSEKNITKKTGDIPAFSNSRLRTNQLLITLAKLSKGNNSQQGISLLECLIAIVVIAVVITSFTPPIFIAVGTRIQNRRAEQALQLAQGEVDRVKRTMERGVYTDNDLPPAGSQGDNNFRNESGPSSSISPSGIPSTQSYPSNASTAVSVDVNGDGTDDFLVQTYRSPGVRDSSTQKNLVAFNIGVRVYAISAKDNLNLGQLGTRQASLAFTTAIGQQRKQPLAVIYTSVIRSDLRTSLQCYQQLLNSASPFQCNN